MFNDKKIFILGMGRSGVSVAKLLSKNNKILITDMKDNKNDVSLLENLGVEVKITVNQAELLDSTFDVVVKNPGVKLDNPVVLKAQKLNIPIITELEVAYRYLPKVRIIGITGSNGKTTTTTIIYNILKEAGLPVHLAGNIGFPLCNQIEDIKDGDVLVVEISSHQLVNLDKFKVDVAVLTNLSPVHLDHFGTYDNYKNNKLRIFNNQTDKDIAILNKGDSEVFNLTRNLKSNKKYFSSKGEADIYINDKSIVYNDEIYNFKDIRVKGMHNYENIMASILAVKQFDVSYDDIMKVLSKFVGVEHRIEFVKEVNGREFYNDSKATNVMSTITALKAFENDVILLLGGLDRGHSFDDLVPYLNHTKYIVCFGETKNRIEEFAKKNNIDVYVVDDIKEATKKAYEISKKGDTILLSPACASWDQFNSFEERGDAFKEVINNL
ncbi:MAG: UDP-N-acetylmuramoyl-L-alanine--D-glutamate ligase [Bacilli bacterium]|nr:UDP-N-acetylmuramoyl-L-alanine--D-glutamate ligase [Bacilli bacterium]